MRYILGLTLALASSAAFAQKEPWQEYDKYIKSAQVIESPGPELFGDAVNLYTGATTFSATDVSLPGENALPVAFGRNFAPKNDQRNWPLGDWDWSIPYVGGVFGHDLGWVLAAAPGGTANRCSAATDLNGARPPRGRTQDGGGVRGGNVEEWEYWSGYQLVTPTGGQEVLFATTDSKPKPADGKVYPWVTKQFWYLSCLPSLRSGQPGEGFLAVAPDGTRYRFDWMVIRPTLDLVKPVVYEGRPSNRVFARDDIRLYPTRVEDRFGNWVDYQWTGGRLDRIVASDGRQLNLFWESNGGGGERVARVTTASREWRYGYSQYNQLTSVLLPDQSSWSINLSSLWGDPAYDPDEEISTTGTLIYKQDKAVRCSWMRALLPLSRTASIRHPSGALAEFEFRTVRHGRTYVAQTCMDPPDISPRPDPDPQTKFGEESVFSMVPARFDVLAMQSKRVSGPGLAASQWSYAYQTPVGGWANDCANCATTKTTTLTAPDGVRTVNTYGVAFNHNDGQLLKTETIGASGLVRSTQTSYITNDEAPYQAFSERIGMSPQSRLDSFSSERLRPVKGSSIVQDGVEFKSTVDSFDAFARNTRITTSNNQGYSKTDAIEYSDNLTQWVTGQVKRSINSNTGQIVSQTDYDPATALPVRTYNFGKLKYSLAYYPDGTLFSVTDGRNFSTVLSNSKRGIPQKVQYPATQESPSGAAKLASVNDEGWITSIVDENGYPTNYRYDPMGRLAQIDYPGEADRGWNATTQSFGQTGEAYYGLPAGHWVQMVGTGNARKVTYYDALWRPVIEENYDAADLANTHSFVVKRYDSQSRLVFQSYPVRSLSSYTDASLTGTYTDYDALGRVTQVRQDSEHGPLVTKTEYLPGLQTRTTDPRGVQAVTRFMAWDQPKYDLPVLIDQAVGKPEQAATQIVRDFFGKPTALQRRNVDGSTSVWRRYVYDGQQQLCKTIEPETGASVMAYDGAGNLGWSAAGLNLPDSNACNSDLAFASGRRVDRTYDGRNRLQTLRFPDGRGDQTWYYTPDGLKSRIVTYNAGGSAEPVENLYVYNRRRLLTGESVGQPGYTWGVGYGYDDNGLLATQSYPSGLMLRYSPNALGQPSGVWDSATGAAFASGTQYYPNGALKQFTYGNGIVHTMTQNGRQLPVYVRDVGAVNSEYRYDGNGNVTQILDYQRGDQYARDLRYDALNRLTDAGSPSFGGDHWHHFTYDALDNIRSWKLAYVKDYASYVYDASNRLTNIQNSQGASIIGLDYDPQGNLANKNGQLYGFDFGNRLRGVAGKEEQYRYDGLGRRVHALRPDGGITQSMYSQAGQVLFQYNTSTPLVSEHIYFGGSLLASRERGNSSAYTLKYQHTDALGSPVAVTNEAGQVIERTDWEPFGAAIGKPAYNGIGYTGHLMDGATALTYMQQRYYDTGIGRFLSVDPVKTDGSTGDNFNRYKYANDNPYRFTDPDGRMDIETRKDLAEDRSSMSSHPSLRGAVTTIGGAASVGGNVNQARSAGAAPGVNSSAPLQNANAKGWSASSIFTGDKAITGTGVAALGVGVKLEKVTGPANDKVSIVTPAVGLSATGTVNLLTVGYRWSDKPAPVDVGIGAGVQGGYIIAGGAQLTYDPGGGISFQLSGGVGAGASVDVFGVGFKPGGGQ